MNRTALLIATVTVWGCSSLTVTMVRPGQVAARSYSLGAWSAAKPEWQGALDDFLSSLKKEIAAAPSDAPVWKQQGGAVVLEGELTAYSFEQHEERQDTTCLTTKSGQSVESPCVAVLARGLAQVSLTMRVRDGAGKLLSSTQLPLSVPVRSGPLVFESRQDPAVLAAHPVQVDGTAALTAARGVAATRLAAVIAPHAAAVSRTPPACDDGQQNCQTGTVALQQCDFAKAKKLFAAAAASLQKDPKKKSDAAAALWGEALAAELSGDAVSALELLQQANALSPQADYTSEPNNVRVEQAYAQQADAAGLETRCIRPVQP
jgi:tetratricopeptide (TPR) repeat protein